MASCPHDWEIYFAPVHQAMIADWRMPWVQGVWTVLNLSPYQAIVKFNDSKIHCFASWEITVVWNFPPFMERSHPPGDWQMSIRSDRLPEKWPKPNSFRFPRINWSRGLCDSFTAMWSVWYQAKLCVNERQKETFGFLLTRKLSVQEITLARLKVNGCNSFFRVFCIIYYKSEQFLQTQIDGVFSGFTSREGFLNSSLGFVNKNLLQENMFF